MSAESRPVVRSRGLAFPVLLIALGVYVYLVNTGVVPAPRWSDLAALWPLVLVLVGVDLLVGPRAPLLALVAIVTIVALALAAVSVAPTATPLVQRARIPLDAAVRGAVELTFGAGRLALTGGSSAFAEVSSTREDVQSRIDRAGSTARLTIAQPEGLPLGGGPDVVWDVRLNGDVRYDLDLKLGAGDFDVDLANVRVASATVNVGAADLRLVLPRPDGTLDISLRGGAASIVVEIPAGVEARIDTSGSSLTSVSGPTETAGYASATNRVRVDVRTGAASIRIVRVGG